MPAAEYMIIGTRQKLSRCEQRALLLWLAVGRNV